MLVIDLKLSSVRRHPACGISTSPQEQFHFRRQTGFLPSSRPSPLAYLPTVSESLPGESQGQGVHLSRSVSLHGLRTIDLSGEFARYRSLSACPEQQALSHGHPQPGLTKHFGQRQQDSRLAHLGSRNTRGHPVGAYSLLTHFTSQNDPILNS